MVDKEQAQTDKCHFFSIICVIGTNGFSIYIYTLLVCLFVCSYPINVKTAEPIGPKFCVGPYMTPGKVYGKIKISKIIQQNSIFIKFWKLPNFFIKFANFLSLFHNTYKEKMLTIKIESGRETPWKPGLYIYFACLSVYLSICIQSSKRLNRSGPHVVWDLTRPR